MRQDPLANGAIITLDCHLCMPQLARFAWTRLVRDLRSIAPPSEGTVPRVKQKIKEGTQLNNPLRNETCQRRLPSVTNTCYDYCNFNNKHGVF